MTPAQLTARFPYQFSGPDIGLQFYLGWMPIVAKLCEDVDAVLGENKRGFHWVQWKEKFGSARFHWSIVGRASLAKIDGSVVQRIQRLVEKACSATTRTCIACGDPGTIDEDQEWMLCLCERHAKASHAGALTCKDFVAPAGGPMALPGAVITSGALSELKSGADARDVLSRVSTYLLHQNPASLRATLAAAKSPAYGVDESDPKVVLRYNPDGTVTRGSWDGGGDFLPAKPSTK